MTDGGRRGDSPRARSWPTLDWRVAVALAVILVAFLAAITFPDYVPFASIWAVVIACTAFARPRDMVGVGVVGVGLTIVGGFITDIANQPIFWVRVATFAVIGVISVLLSAQRTRREALLIDRATTDALTGLANRRLLIERLEAQMQVRGRGTRTAVLYADLDQFKNVNDSLGHAAGDEVLVRASERLKACTRQAETLARFGGDEFVIACPSIESREEVVALCDRILEAFDKSFRSGTTEVSVGITIGVAIAESDSGIDPSTLIDAADDALTAQKRAGRGAYEIVELAS